MRCAASRWSNTHAGPTPEREPAKGASLARQCSRQARGAGAVERHTIQCSLHWPRIVYTSKEKKTNRLLDPWQPRPPRRTRRGHTSALGCQAFRDAVDVLLQHFVVRLCLCAVLLHRRHPGEKTCERRVKRSGCNQEYFACGQVCWAGDCVGYKNTPERPSCVAMMSLSARRARSE